MALAVVLEMMSALETLATAVVLMLGWTEDEFWIVDVVDCRIEACAVAVEPLVDDAVDLIDPPSRGATTPLAELAILKGFDHW